MDTIHITIGPEAQTFILAMLCYVIGVVVGRSTPRNPK